MSNPAGLENERLLGLFFSQSLDGFFIMMLDEPVEWEDHVKKDEVMDFVFEHLRLTKVNSAVVTQVRASSAEELPGWTPAQFVAHDLAAAKTRTRGSFDRGRPHNEADERRLDGTRMRVEGTTSLGLVGMRERAPVGGGELRSVGTPNAGTIVLLTVPMTPAKS